MLPIDPHSDPLSTLYSVGGGIFGLVTCAIVGTEPVWIPLFITVAGATAPYGIKWAIGKAVDWWKGVKDRRVEVANKERDAEHEKALLAAVGEKHAESRACKAEDRAAKAEEKLAEHERRHGLLPKQEGTTP